jgi:phosphate transport system substrate-binding protein
MVKHDVSSAGAARIRQSLYACGICCAVFATSVLAAEVRIGGAGTTLGTMQELATAYEKAHPGEKATVLAKSLGAIGGVEALNAGELDIAMATRQLTDTERGQLRMDEFARIPFVFAVASGNRTGNVTSRQLLEIYQMKMVEWPDGSRIRLVLRPAKVSDTMFLKELSPEWKKAMEDLDRRSGMIRHETAQEAASAVETTPGALTTSTINLIVTEKRQMKALNVDGAAPTSVDYKYFKPLFMVTLPKRSEAVEKFVGFVRTKAGQDILARTGHLGLGQSRR